MFRVMRTFRRTTGVERLNSRRATPLPPECRRRRGAILVLATLFLSIALIFTAFVTDIGYISLEQARIQSATDAAALGAAMDMADGEEAVRRAVEELLRLNGFDPDANPQITFTPTYGKWSEDEHRFAPTSFKDADALQVNVQHVGVPAFFGVAMGHERYTVGASAVAGVSGGPPLDVVLVLDCSESMSARMANGQTRMANTRDAAQRLVAQLKEDDRAGLAVFSWRDTGRSRFDRTGLVETWMNHELQPTRNRINQLQAGHYVDRGLGTNIGGGLRAGLDVFLKPGQPRDAESAETVQRVMVLLTDGQVNLAEPYPTTNTLSSSTSQFGSLTREYDSRESVRRWAATIKGLGIKLYVVTVSDEGYDPLMAQIASPPDEVQASYYYHVADGNRDFLELLDVFESIGRHGRGTKLLQ